MSLSTIRTLLLATPFASSLSLLTSELVPLIADLGHRIVAFRTQPVTPAATCAFEADVQRQLLQMGRVLLGWVYNRLEPDDPAQAPAQVKFEHDLYRRRERSPRRRGVATLFGIIALWRLRYEPCDEGVGLVCVFPLEERLGLLMGKATPALAQRLGPWAAQHTQQNVLNLLQQEHHVSWSVETLRTMTAALSAAVSPLRHQAQVAQLQKLLRQAHEASGPHRPVLCVGRDGIFVPIRNDTNYREGSTATVSVLDRHGHKLGTMFLGQMPQPGQETLSQQLTALIRDVLNQWHGPLPRLQYVTDGGHHPTDYCESVVLNMLHPRTGAQLPWEWILDYYHACQYITKMAEALFGKVSFTPLGSHFWAKVAELSSEGGMCPTPRIWQTAESIYPAPRSMIFLSYPATTPHFSALLNSAICAGVGRSWASRNGFTTAPTNGTPWWSGSNRPPARSARPSAR
jgi:hypothetical protein